MLVEETPSEDPVDRASDLYEQEMSHDVAGEDLYTFYDHLGEMDASEIEEFAELNPGINQYSLPLQSSEESLVSWPSGSDGAEWWLAMDDEQQEAMLTAVPLLVGNTEAISYTIRDAANRNFLDDILSTGDIMQNQRDRLEEVRKSLSYGDNRFLPSLNMGTPTHESRSDASAPQPADPLAGVSVGNPDEADTTSFNVSGMYSDTKNMSSEVRGAQQLYDGLEESSEDGHAVVSWVGYESPGAKPVLRNKHAQDGAWALAHALDGYRESEEIYNRETRVNINSHSYGTTTSAIELNKTRHNFDSYIMYGSAEISSYVAENFSDFNVNQNSSGEVAVYATEVADFWAGVGQSPGNRSAPTDPEFDASFVSSDSITNILLCPVYGHVKSINGESRLEDLDSDG